MSLDPILWAMKDAPVADVEEYAILMIQGEAADEDGCNAFQSIATIAGRAKIDEKTVKRRLAAMELRGLIRRGDQQYPLLLQIRADRRPVNYDLMIPRSWWATKWDRMNRWRGEHGRPELAPEDRPDLAAAPEATPRTDKGIKRPRADEGTDRDPVDEGTSSPSVDHGGTTSPARGDYQSSNGGTASPPNKPIRETHPGTSPARAPRSPAATTRAARLPEDWTPTPDDLAAVRADAPDVDLDRELRRFKDYWLSASGRTATKTEWGRAYRNWMRKAQDDLPSPRRFSRPPTRVTETVNALDALGDTLRARERDLGLTPPPEPSSVPALLPTAEGLF